MTWILILSTIVCAAEPAKEQPARDPSDCELIIAGKHIEKLSLVNKAGLDKVIVRPGPSIFLPPGRYRIQEIQLQEGYTFNDYSGSAENRFTLSPDAPYKLMAGAPLTPGVTVKRQGRMLTMDYQLLDAEGRKYINRANTNPPRFDIYQGDQKIASGSFEYG